MPRVINFNLTDYNTINSGKIETSFVPLRINVKIIYFYLVQISKFCKTVKVKLINNRLFKFLILKVIIIEILKWINKVFKFTLLHVYF